MNQPPPRAKLLGKSGQPAGISLASGLPTFRGTDPREAEELLPAVCTELGAT